MNMLKKLEFIISDKKKIFSNNYDIFEKPFYTEQFRRERALYDIMTESIVNHISCFADAFKYRSCFVTLKPGQRTCGDEL